MIFESVLLENKFEKLCDPMRIMKESYDTEISFLNEMLEMKDKYIMNESTDIESLNEGMVSNIIKKIKEIVRKFIEKLKELWRAFLNLFKKKTESFSDKFKNNIKKLEDEVENEETANKVKYKFLHIDQLKSYLNIIGDCIDIENIANRFIIKKDISIIDNYIEQNKIPTIEEAYEVLLNKAEKKSPKNIIKQYKKLNDDIKKVTDDVNKVSLDLSEKMKSLEEIITKILKDNEEVNQTDFLAAVNRLSGYCTSIVTVKLSIINKIHTYLINLPLA